MAEIYRVPEGVRTRGRDRLNYVAAHHVDTAAALELHAAAIFERAAAKLARHRDTGASQVVHERGDVDHYIVLVDDNALAIEFETVGVLRQAVERI